MNYLIVDGVYIDERIDVDVIDLEIPKMATLRNDTKNIWGRDGYVNGIENAYEEEDYPIQLLCESAKGRKVVLKQLSTAKREIKINLKSEKYTRIGKVVEHNMEWISVTSSLHTITLKLQPFYIVIKELGKMSTPRLNYDNYSDISAMVKLEITGTENGLGRMAILGAGKQICLIDVTDKGLVIDSLKKEVTYAKGYYAGKPAGSALIGVNEIYSPGTNATAAAYRYVKGSNWRFPFIPPVSEVGKGYALQVVKKNGLVESPNTVVKATVYERYLLPHDVFDGMEV